MEYNQKAKPVLFDIQERIPLGENITEVALVQNVEVKPYVEMISEYTSYRIKGFLEFTCEFEGKGFDDVADDDDRYEPFLVEQGAKGNKKNIKKIAHQIPVDITLPSERVDEEVILQVTSLDYELAPPNHLLVTTKISLSGVLEDEPKDEPIFETADKLEPYVVEENSFWKFPSELEIEKSTMDLLYKQGQLSPTLKENEQVGENNISDSFETEEGRIEDRPSFQNELHVKPDEKAESTFEQDFEVVEMPSKNFEQVTSDVGAHENPQVEVGEEPAAETGEEVVEAEEVEDVEEVKVSIGRRHLLERKPEASSKQQKEKSDHKGEKQTQTLELLSKFLGNRNESYTQMKLYLVQPGESIQDIAQRYEVSAEDILHYNRVEGSGSLSGKILKIPQAK